MQRSKNDIHLKSLQKIDIYRNLEVGFEPSEERHDIEKAARTLQLPSDKPVILTGTDIEPTSDQLPETKYFGGDGPNLEKEVERRKIIKIFREKINNTELLTKKERAKLLKVITTNVDAFGLLQGTGQMSALSPEPHLA
eukprot:snap_masked-scaffold_28-processed-gene-3.29-mRNA-1 protein AED:1.00 eAED:1.00 QI:0/0/0/0/1/1/2/0/138